MLKTLRRNEEVVLHQHIREIHEAEKLQVQHYLADEYARESLDHPFTSPAFDVHAASWAAEIVYKSAQLMLYREHDNADLAVLLPAYNAPQTASSWLSADLTLRFLPDITTHLKVIDADDPLVPVLEGLLQTWHYSAIAYPLEWDTINFQDIDPNPCLWQMYVNRVIRLRNAPLARNPFILEKIRASLGDFAAELWPGLKTDPLLNE